MALEQGEREGIKETPSLASWWHLNICRGIALLGESSGDAKRIGQALFQLACKI